MCQGESYVTIKGNDMDLSNYSQEIQNYITNAEDRRKRTGGLDYDTCQGILKYAAETNSDALFGVGYYYFAEYYWINENAKQTMYCLGECTKCFLTVKMYDYLARAYNMMGEVSESRGNRLVALSYFYSSVQYAERSKDSYAQAMAHSNVGYILICMKHYREAAEHYQQAIALYEKSEETFFRRKNITRSMVECGFCYLVLEQKENALNLWDRIQELLREDDQVMYSKLCLLAFETGCEVARGNRERAKELADSLEEQILEQDSLMELENILVVIIDLLDLTNGQRRFESLMGVLDQKGIQKNSVIYLDMYPFKSRYLLRKNKIEEYVSYTKQYLSLYQQQLEDSKAATARILELQDTLRRMELEQKDIEAYNQKLEEIALYDSMTNLANRACLNEYLSQKFEEAIAERSPFGVELLDIDHFKEYNDAYGHLTGDVCIEAVAEILKKVSNENVFCARYGGDEFMIVYSGMTEQEIRGVAEQIQNQVRALQIYQEATGLKTSVTVSQGIFICIPDAEDREWDFNSMADKALYQTKEAGRDGYRIFTEFE